MKKIQLNARGIFWTFSHVDFIQWIYSHLNLLKQSNKFVFNAVLSSHQQITNSYANTQTNTHIQHSSTNSLLWSRLFVVHKMNTKNVLITFSISVSSQIKLRRTNNILFEVNWETYSWKLKRVAFVFENVNCICFGLRLKSFDHLTLDFAVVLSGQSCFVEPETDMFISRDCSRCGCYTCFLFSKQFF